MNRDGFKVSNNQFAFYFSWKYVSIIFLFKNVFVALEKQISFTSKNLKFNVDVIQLRGRNDEEWKDCESNQIVENISSRSRMQRNLRVFRVCMRNKTCF